MLGQLLVSLSQLYQGDASRGMGSMKSKVKLQGSFVLHKKCFYNTVVTT